MDFPDTWEVQPAATISLKRYTGETRPNQAAPTSFPTTLLRFNNKKVTIQSAPDIHSQGNFTGTLSFYKNEHGNYMTSNHISLKCHRFPHKSFTHGPCQKIIVQKFAAVAVQQLPKTILGRSRPGGALGPRKNRGRDGNTLERRLGG